MQFKLLLARVALNYSVTMTQKCKKIILQSQNAFISTKILLRRCLICYIYNYVLPYNKVLVKQSYEIIANIFSYFAVLTFVVFCSNSNYIMCLRYVSNISINFNCTLVLYIEHLCKFVEHSQLIKTVIYIIWQLS